MITRGTLNFPEYHAPWLKAAAAVGVLLTIAAVVLMFSTQRGHAAVTD